MGWPIVYTMRKLALLDTVPPFTVCVTDLPATPPPVVVSVVVSVVVPVVPVVPVVASVVAVVPSVDVTGEVVDAESVTLVVGGTSVVAGSVVGVVGLLVVGGESVVPDELSVPLAESVNATLSSPHAAASNDPIARHLPTH